MKVSSLWLYSAVSRLRVGARLLGMKQGPYEAKVEGVEPFKFERRHTGGEEVTALYKEVNREQGIWLGYSKIQLQAH